MLCLHTVTVLFKILQLIAINDNPGVLYRAPHVHCGASYCMSNIIIAASCSYNNIMGPSTSCMHAYMYKLS